MKKIYSLLLIVLICRHISYAQEAAEQTDTQWDFNAEMNLYFFQDDLLVLPVFKADKNKLHLEARYNYEDRQTISTWIGYNFSGGEKVEYMISPMIGGVAGLSSGVAPGLEMTFVYKNWELYSESEYLFDVGAKENNFLYTWSDLSYSPKEWLWVGISGQRTRLYQTNLDIQRGLLIGTSIKNWEVNGYLYNLGFDDPFFLFSLSIGF